MKKVGIILASLAFVIVSGAVVLSIVTQKIGIYPISVTSNIDWYVHYEEQNYKMGDTVTLKSKDVDGYRFDYWKKDDDFFSKDSEVTFTLTKMNAYSTYTAVYIHEYRVQMAWIKKGKVTPNIKNAIAGENINLTIEPDEFYTLTNLYYVNNMTGEEVPIQNNSFVMPSCGVMVHAEFTPYQYTITFPQEVSVTKNGTTINNGDAIYHFDTIVISSNPTEGNDAIYSVSGLNKITWLNDTYKVVGDVSIEYSERKHIPTPSEFSSLMFTDYNDEDNTVHVMASTKTKPVGMLEIPDKIIKNNIIYFVTTINGYGFQNCDQITGVTIPNTIKSIKHYAFTNCTGIEIVIFEDGSNLSEVGKYAFNNCSNLTTINLPETEIVYGINPFYGCHSYILFAIEIETPQQGYLIKTKYNGTFKMTNIEYMGTIEFMIELKNGYSSNGIVVLNNGDSVGVNDDSIYKIENVVENINISISGVNPNTYTIIIPEEVTVMRGEEIVENGGIIRHDEILSLSSIPSEGNDAVYTVQGMTKLTGGVNPTYVVKDNVEIIYNEREHAESVSEYSTLMFTDYNDEDKTVHVMASSKIKPTGNLVIPGKVLKKENVYTVIIINGYGFQNCDQITSVTIPNTIKSIKHYAFTNCISLISVNFESNSNISDIGEYAFNNCSELEGISIPNSVTQLGQSLFFGCGKIESITIPFVGDKIKTTSDTYQYPFGFIFGKKTYNGSVAVKQYYYGSNLEKTTNSTYYIPESLKTVCINGGNLLYGAFYNCSTLVGISANNTTMLGNNIFYNCSGLTNITLNNSVGNIGNKMFYNCGALTNILLPNNIICIGTNAFYNCCSIENIIIPSMVESIGKDAFNGCTGLKKVTIENSIDDWLNISFENAYSNPLSYGKALYIGENEVNDIEISNNITQINNYAFYNCRKLLKLVIPSSVENIGTSAFQNCYALAEVYNASTLNITKGSTNYGYVGKYAEYVQSDMNSSSRIKISNGVAYYVYQKEYVAICLVDETIKSLTFDSETTKIRGNAFRDCTGLEHVFVTNKVVRISDNAFCGCVLLKDIYIPVNVEKIISTNDNYSNSPFYNCSSELIIYTGAISKPSGWNNKWNFYGKGDELFCMVEWNFSSEDYINIISQND